MLETLSQENHGVLYERLFFILYGTVWFLLAFWLGSRYNYFQLPEERFKQLPPNFLRHMIGAFLIFFFTEAILVPVYLALWLKGNPAAKLSQYVTGWLTVAAIVAAAAGVLIYYLFLPKTTKKVVQGIKGFKISDFISGAATLFFAAPIVMVFSQLIAIILPFFTHKPVVDQTVVQHLKEMGKYPLVFWTTALGVVTFVPIVEEILFRGFLQSWLYDIVGRFRAIILTSVIFAGFHFSFSQGIFNIELLVSLFILSCFLGFIYEKRQSIWASIGLHFIFNSIGIILIASEIKLL